MSIRDDKRNILNKIGAFSSLRENLDTKASTNSMKSVSNRKDVIPFLLDVLKTIVGTEALKNLTGEVISNFIDKTETGLKKTLKNQFTQYNSDDNLPNSFKNNGITLKIKKIDTDGKFKVDPTTDIGKSIYKEYTFDKTMHDAILNPNLEINYENTLLLKYDKVTDSITFKPHSSVANKKIGEFFGDYIDKSVLINKKEIVTKALNAIYGNIDKNQNKTLNEIINEQKNNKILDKIIDGENNIDITNDELIEIEKKSKEILDGKLTHYMGCGYVTTEITDDDLVSTVDSACTSSDANYIGNVLESNLNNDISNSDDEAVKENKDSVKDGYFSRIVKELVLALVKAATISPQIKMLMSFSKSFQNIDDSIDDGTNYVKNNIILIRCLINELIKELGEFIFKKTSEFLIQLLKPILIRMAKEKIKQYSEIIKSLSLKK